MAAEKEKLPDLRPRGIEVMAKGHLARANDDRVA